MTQLTCVTEGKCHIVFTRRFAAPPDLVYRAHVEPELLRRWMLGPDGWTITHCVSDARPGGAIRVDWADGNGASFHITGHYVELQPGRRILHVERMHLPDATPDNLCETIFQAENGGTLLTLRMTLPDAESRAKMLATGMQDGMEASYARIDPLWSAEEAT